MMVRLHMIELTEVPDSDGKKENSGSEEQEPGKREVIIRQNTVLKF